MPDTVPDFVVKIAETEEELRAAQALRYSVFIRELGGDGSDVDHETGLEIDQFDPFADHLILQKKATGQVIGVYRLLRTDQAQRAGQFYSEREYDLSVLTSSNRRLLELGRSCVDKDYRGGTAMFHLWNGLANYVVEHEIEILFGVASFHGTNIADFAQQLSVLHYNYLAPENLRVQARAISRQNMNLVEPDNIDRRQAMVNMPSLIKAYLRLGGFVGEGAYVDHAFNTTDVCLVLDTGKMSERQKRLYTGSV